MAKFVISDLHLGHENILKFCPERHGKTIGEHDEWLISQWNSVVSLDDTVYVLGDVTFNPENLKMLKRMCGNKLLIRGNHDKLSTGLYLKYFQEVYGIFRHHQFWLTHAPIHPASLRGGYNIHGHMHSNTLDDPRYISACVEQCNGVPLNLTEMLKNDKYEMREEE